MAIRKLKEQKRKRIPVSGNKDILTVEGKDDGFVYRWVNDTDEGRIATFKAAGYETVDAPDIEIGQADVKEASTLGKTVTKNVGQGTTAVLMRIDQKWYDEDQAVKADGVRAKVESLNEHIEGLSGKHGSIKIS